MADSNADQQFMSRALDLARQGIGLVSPNPCVGAVLVDKSGEVAGTGSYTYAGLKHAEVQALEQAGQKARGATLYINLEPCSHFGRTPPCADALVAAGIRRVVASMIDPNPAVIGQGFEKLRAAGIQVEIGPFAEQARRLNEAFAQYVRHRVPFVTLKSAMTLDAKIASTNRTGASTADRSPDDWITGEATRKHVQELRHAQDAILVGAGTILADNPLLTDRSGHPRRRPLLRVVLDSELRTPLESRLVQSAENDVLIFCLDDSPEKRTALEDRGVRVERLHSDQHGQIDLHTVVQRLGEIEITSLMIEGGSGVNNSALARGIVDKVFLYYAPKLFGSSGVPFAMANEGLTMKNPIRIKMPVFYQFDHDFAVEGYLRDPYQD